MGNTEVLKREVEDHIRSALKEEFGTAFESRRVVLEGVQGNPSDHEFDAVAADGSVIAGIISSRAKTSGGRRNVGAVHHATGELYYLTLTKASRKILVCTSANFRDLMASVTAGRLARGLEIRHMPLTPDLERRAQAIRTASSAEMTGGKTGSALNPQP